MTITPDAKNKSVTVSFADNEWALLVEINKRQATGFRDTLTGWLRNSVTNFVEEDRRMLLARISTLTAPQIESIKQALGM